MVSSNLPTIESPGGFALNTANTNSGSILIRKWGKIVSVSGYFAMKETNADKVVFDITDDSVKPLVSPVSVLRGGGTSNYMGVITVNESGLVASATSTSMNYFGLIYLAR